MNELCQGFTKKGEKCKYKCKYGIYCGVHKESKEPKIPKKPKRKFDGIDLPRIPERLKEKLANASDIGIKKIKEQIIQMWLEDGGSYSILQKYENRIPVAEDVYKILLQEFNGEEFVMNQIFVKPDEIPKKTHEQDNYKETNKIYGSTRVPLVPTSLLYYSDFIPMSSKLLNKEQKESFNILKTFIFKKWTELGEIIYKNKIYLTKKVYDGAYEFIKNKVKEVNGIYPVDIEFWTNYIMTNIFSIGEEKKEPSKPFKNPKKAESEIPKRKITISNIENELIKIFPDKDVKIYLEVITKNTRDYTINSNSDIHKLYREFHPDKCNSDQKTTKLCNLFCGRVENIKKLWNYKKNPNVASPISSRQNEIELVLKFLNDEL